MRGWSTKESSHNPQLTTIMTKIKISIKINIKINIKIKKN